VPDEGLFLDFVGPVVMVEIEAGLAHRYNFGLRSQAFDLLEGFSGELPGLLRMKSHRREDLGKFLGQPHRLQGGLQVDPGLNDEPHSGRARRYDQVGSLLFRLIEMGVGVDQHRLVFDAREQGRAGRYDRTGNSEAPPRVAPGHLGSQSHSLSNRVRRRWDERVQDHTEKA